MLQGANSQLCNQCSGQGTGTEAGGAQAAADAFGVVSATAENAGHVGITLLQRVALCFRKRGLGTENGAGSRVAG